MANVVPPSEVANFSIIASAIDQEDPTILCNLVQAGIDLWPALAASNCITSCQHPVEDGDTPLIYAARAGNFEAVKCLTEYFFERDDYDSTENKTLSEGAVCHNSCHILCGNGDEPTFEYKTGDFVSVWRSARGDDKTALDDCTFYDILDWRNALEETALIAATAKGHLDIVAYLILNGAEAFQCSCYAVVSCEEAGTVCWRGFKALDIAAERGDLEMIDCLLDAVTNVNAPDRHGKKALIYFTCFGYTDVIKALIERGANLDEASRSGWTPLMCAVVTHKMEMVECFLENGADPKCVDKRGNNVLLLALQWSSEPLEDVKLLLKYGVSVNVLNNAQFTPLMFAQTNDVVDILIKAGAIIDLELHFATITGHTTAVQALVQHGAVPRVRNISSLPDSIPDSLPADFHDLSPLQAAILTGHAEIAEYLISNWFLTQYDIHKLFWNEEVRSYVRSKDYHDCLSLLMGYGAIPWSLVIQCFVLVSTILGDGAEREGRVRNLLVPIILQRKLLCLDENGFQ